MTNRQKTLLQPTDNPVGKLAGHARRNWFKYALGIIVAGLLTAVGDRIGGDLWDTTKAEHASIKAVPWIRRDMTNQLIRIESLEQEVAALTNRITIDERNIKWLRDHH